MSDAVQRQHSTSWDSKFRLTLPSPCYSFRALIYNHIQPWKMSDYSDYKNIVLKISLSLSEWYCKSANEWMLKFTSYLLPLLHINPTLCTFFCEIILIAEVGRLLIQSNVQQIWDIIFLSYFFFLPMTQLCSLYHSLPCMTLFVSNNMAYSDLYTFNHN